jgi:hypothetical protein
MRCLELFCVTKSVGSAFERIGWEVVSLDIDPKCNPTHCHDIMSWDYRVYPSNFFNFVFASPVCQHYSIARTTGGPRDLVRSDGLVRRTLEIISYFVDCRWAFENPQSGLLKTRIHLIGGLPFFDTSYCRYGFPYRKTTRLWTNLALSLREPCTIRNPCSAVVNKRHPMTAQQGRRGSDAGDVKNSCSQRRLYTIPDELCDEIAAAANPAVLESDCSAVQPHARTDVQTQAAFIPEEL